MAGASHRKIAARADVPLGSMTYHFSGMEELLHEAFTRFSATCRMLDALIEGSFLHAALDTEQHDRAVTAEAVARITTPLSPRDH